MSLPVRADILAQNPIVPFLESRGIDLRKTGENFDTGSCPISPHNKKGHRPVTVYPAEERWHCHDHDDGGTVIDWVMHEKNITAFEAMQSLNGEHPKSKPKGKDKIVAEYDYHDAHGERIYQILRKQPENGKKYFQVRRPDSNGGWIYDMGPVKPVLYHLPQVLAAQIVVIVEGEKNADDASSLGYVATTNPFGAGKWEDDYVEPLKDKIVVVFGDIHDSDKKGQKHTEKVLRSLTGKTKSLKHPIQPKDFNDISDWICYLHQTSPGEERETIQQLIDATPEFQRASGSKRFGFNDLMEFDAKHDPNCLVGNRYLVRGGSALWAAGSGYGKSTLALQLAVYWGCGQSCFGLRPVRPLKSLLIQAENDLGDMGEQLQGVMTGIDSLGDIDVQASRELIEKNVLIYRAIGITGDDFLSELDILLTADKPELAWVDPLFAFAGCDLLNPKETSRFLRVGLFPMADRRRVAMNVIHHVGKPVRADTKTGAEIADIDLQYLGFGTSEIQNAFRVVNVLVPVSGDSNLFKLALSKRGERSGAGRSIYLRHSTEGMICWMQAEPPDKPKQAKFDVSDILEQMSAIQGAKAVDLQKRCLEQSGIRPATFWRLWKSLKRAEKIRTDSDDLWYSKIA